MLGHCATWGQKKDLSGASSREVKLGVEVRQWEAECRNSQMGWRTRLEDGALAWPPPQSSPCLLLPVGIELSLLPPLAEVLLHG